MYLFVINISVYYRPGGKFFTPFFVVKLVVYSRFSNALSETLWTYTFLVWSLSGVDTDNFQHRYTNFGHTNLGMPKFSLKSYLNYQKEQLQFFNYIDNIKIIMKKWKIRIAYSLFGPHNHNSRLSYVTICFWLQC